MQVLVIGSALREVCGDQAALGLAFVEDVSTAPRYRLWMLDGRFAALVEADDGGIAVPGELVEVDQATWTRILEDEPEGIHIGDVLLEDGRTAPAALGDPVLLAERGTEITSYGGFAAYWRATKG